MAAISAVFVLGGNAMAAPAAQDCRSIADAASRLACYDGKESSPSRPVTAPTENAQPASYRAAEPAPARAETDTKRPSSFDSQVASVSNLNHGFYRVRLADGSEWSTTVIAQPPSVGDAVHYRRSLIGTQFFDIKGRRPLTVIRARQ